MSDKTRLMLCIDQTLTNKIRGDEGALPEGLIIVDEAHERKLSSDILLGMIREGYRVQSKYTGDYHQCNSGLRKVLGLFGGAPIYRIPGRCFPVTRHVVTLGRGEPHALGASRTMTDVLNSFVKGELKVHNDDGIGERQVTSGTVLMLLPGKEDIRNAESVFTRWLSANAEANVEFFQCHGEMDSASQDAIQSPVPDGVLRICAGTEILRASVTIPQTCVVIDTLRVKRMFVDSNGVAHLKTIAISKAEADQGAGRAGRTNSGIYFAMSEGSEYSCLAPNAMPEILQAPLTSAVLQVASVGRNARSFAWVDAPKVDQLEVAFKRLSRLGALDSEERITELGEKLLRFPVDPERAMMLITAEALDVLPEAIILAGIVESGDFFFTPRKAEPVEVDESLLRRVLAHMEKLSWGWTVRSTPIADAEVVLDPLPEWVGSLGQGVYRLDCGSSSFPSEEGARWVADLRKRMWAPDGEGDFVAIVNAYRGFKEQENHIRKNPIYTHTQVKGKTEKIRVSPERRLEQWCRQNFIHNKRLRMAEATMQQIKDEIATSTPLELNFPIVKSRKFRTEALTMAFLAGHPDFVAKSANGQCSGPIGEFQISYGSTCPRSSKLVVVTGVQRIPVRGKRMSFIQLADTAAPVKPEWFQEAAPQLCVRQAKGDIRYDASLDAVVETVRYTFGEFEIGVQPEATADKDRAVEVFASWLAQQMC